MATEAWNSLGTAAVLLSLVTGSLVLSNALLQKSGLPKEATATPLPDSRLSENTRSSEGAFDQIVNFVTDIFKSMMDSLFASCDSISTTASTGRVTSPLTRLSGPANDITSSSPRVTSHSGDCILTCEEERAGRDGLYAYCDVCVWFVECIEGKTFVRNCPPFSYFHPKTSRCDQDPSVCGTIEL